MPTNMQVKVHSSRDRETNRNLAKKRLIEELDGLVNGNLSKRSQEEEKIRRRKERMKRKRKKREEKKGEN